MDSRPVVNALDQVGEILRCVLALPPAEQALFYADAGAGRHVRHILDHVLAFRDGVESGVLDYNRRNRDALIERDPTIASQQLATLQAWLRACADLSGDVTVVSEIDVNAHRDVTVASSVERELLFVVNHTIHHVAYLKLLGQRHGLVFRPDLGLAPATATHQRQ